MTTQQPEALRLAELLELAPEDGIEPQTAEDAAAGLRRLHSENESLQAGYAAARLEIESLRARSAEPGAWVPLPGTLPDPGKPVLLDIGEKYPIRAMWAAKHTLEVGMEDDAEFGEYDEITNTYYCPGGWYEWNEYEDTHWRVDKTPVAWCELPTKTGTAQGDAPAQAAPASQGDALDAARYRYLRDTPMDLWPAELLSAIRLQQNAKWGAQPAVAGEPVMWAYQYSDGSWHDASATEHSAGMKPLYPAPHPTQAQAGAVPMSHEAAKALVRKYGNDPLHLVLQVERHHGIKGGQHGAE